MTNKTSLTLTQAYAKQLSGTWPTKWYGRPLWTWGTNENGQLGLGDTFSRSSPTQVGAGTEWQSVTSGGYTQSAAIKTDGTLWTWGRNVYGTLGLNNTTYYSSPKQVGALTNWKSVIFGAGGTAAIKTNGTLWTWGSNSFGQLGLSDITYKSSPVQVGALTNWAAVSMMSICTAAVKTDGTLWTWGNNSYGLLGQGEVTTINRSSPLQVGSLTTWKSVSGPGWAYPASGASFTSVKTDGTLWTWGRNASGNLGQGEATTVNRASPLQVGLLTDWKSALAAGGSVNAVKTNGTFWNWGYSTDGATQGYRSSPVQVGALTNWSEPVYGRGLSIKTDGTLWGWGYNGGGIIGLGNTTTYASPKQVGTLTTWLAVSAGGYGSIGITG
jgi:alpha-tubulin suppressor-like RCC1 family protein